MIINKYTIVPGFPFLFFIALLTFSCSTKPFEDIDESYPDGSIKTVKIYKNESKESLLSEVHYYEDGQKKMEGDYKNGNRTGQWSYWYPDGKLWSQGVYEDGKENGLKTVWYENGQKYYEGVNKDDQRVGVWKFWNERGVLLKQVDYNK